MSLQNKIETTSRIHAFFFDLDGTLIDSKQDIKKCLEQALQKSGVSISDFDAKFQIGPPLSIMLDNIAPELTDISRQKVMRSFRELYDASEYPNTDPYAGICTLLKELTARATPLFIATNKPLFATQRIIRKMGWDIFTGILTPDSSAVARSKADLLLWASQQWNLSSASSLMVGDLPDDMRAASAVGMKAAGVTWGYGKAQELVAANPSTSLFNTPEQLLKEIERIT